MSREALDCTTLQMLCTVETILFQAYGSCANSGDYPMETLSSVNDAIERDPTLLLEVMRTLGYKRRLTKFTHPSRLLPSVDVATWKSLSDLGKAPKEVINFLLYLGVYRKKVSSNFKRAETMRKKRALAAPSIEEEEATLEQLRKKRRALEGHVTDEPQVSAEPSADEFEAGGF